MKKNIFDHQIKGGSAAIFISLLFLLCFSKTFAGIEKVNTRNSGTDLYENSIVQVKDDKWPNMQVAGQYTVKKGIGKIIFGVNEYDLNHLVAAYSLTAELEITWYDISGVAHVIPNPVLLSISYDPSNSYVDKSIFVINGAYRIVAKVKHYRSGNTIIPNVDLPANIYLEAEQETERYYNFDHDYIHTNASYTVLSQNIPSSNELEISWQQIPGAEEYDLEWTFINDYDEQQATYKPQTDLFFTFRDNATRIRTADLSYKLSLTYEHGYLLFRVRGVGRKFDSNTQNYEIITGNWSADPLNSSLMTVAEFVSNAAANISCNYPITIEHESKKNWQYSASFSEEGKKKEVISYFDGSLRNRQSVTKVNSENQAVVGETFYDYQGRPSLEALPVPAYVGATSLPEQKIQYFEDFNKSELSDQQYNRDDFDIDNGATCPPSAAPMKTTSGASQYYSVNNPDKAGQQAYVPDAQKYPFSQTIYTPDNTGRIRRQSGVGPNHKINSGHETTYLYSRPNQEELDILFGSEAGQSIRYKKNTVVDANGQISISYMDEEGKVIATSLAGNSPQNVGSIGGPQIQANTVYFSYVNTDYHDVNKDINNALVFTTPIVPTVAGIYEFDYSLQVPQFNDECITNFCYDCVYDLEITIKDECGNLIYSTTPAKIKVGANMDYECSAPITFLSSDFTSPFSANLDAAKTYYLVKKLTINQDAVNQYLAHYINPLYNTCIDDLHDFEVAATSDLDLLGCNLDCATCSTNANAYYLLHNDVTRKDDPSYFYINEEVYEAMLEQCEDACKASSLCKIEYKLMLADMTPAGQYSQYKVQTGIYDASMFPLSVLNTGNVFTRETVPATQKDWRHPRFYNEKKHGFITNDIGNPNDIEFYYESDGITKSKIFLTPVDPNTFYPEIVANHQVDGYDENGVPFIYPQYLRFVGDFINRFKPSWSSSLVSYHPEWGYFNWCDDNEDPAFSTYSGKTSQQYDDFLRSMDTWNVATNSVNTAISGFDPYGTNGSISIDDLISSDPFFNGTGKANNVYDIAIMRSKLVNVLPGKTAKEVASLIQRCGTVYYGTCTADFGNPVIPSFTAQQITEILNKEWITYRDFYLIKKAELQMEMNHRNAIGNFPGYDGYFNGCIGSGQTTFDPYSIPNFAGFNSTSPWYTGGFHRPQTQPCSMFGYWYYANKQKRFIDSEDLAIQLANGASSPEAIGSNLQNNTEYQAYLQTGQCPTILKFQYLLDKLTADAQLTSTAGVDLFFYPQLTQDLYDQINGQDQTYVHYYWKLLSPASGQTITGGFFDNNGNNTTCPVVLTLTQNFSWLQVRKLKAIHFGGLSSGVYTFTMTAMVDDDNNSSTPNISVTVTGSSCINSSCHFPDRTCTTNQRGDDLMKLFNTMASRGHLLNNLAGYDLVDPNAPESPFVSNILRNYFGGSTSFFSTSVYNSGTNSENIQLVGESIDCSFNFSFVPVQGAIFPSLNTVNYFTNIQQDPNNALSFFMDAHFINNGVTPQIHDVYKINVTNNCMTVGSCASPTPPSCNTPGFNTLQQLGDFFGVFSKGINIPAAAGQPFNPIDFSGWFGYTSLLQSFIPGSNPTMLTAFSSVPASAPTQISMTFGSEPGCTITLSFSPSAIQAGYNFNVLSYFGAIAANESIDGAFTLEAIMQDGTTQILLGTSCFKLENCSDCSMQPGNIIFSENFESYNSINATSSTSLNFANDFNYTGYNTCSPTTDGSDYLKYSICETNSSLNTICAEPDHTHLGKGNKLFVNMFNSSPDNVLSNYLTLWRTKPNAPISVEPNTNYEFSAWIQSPFGKFPMNPQLIIVDNQNISTMVDSKMAPGGWIQLKGIWYSGNSTSANLFIKGISINGDITTHFHYALIDDITFSRKCTSDPGEPVSTEPPANPCVQQLTDIAMTNASHDYDQYINNIKQDFINRYTAKCKETMEILRDSHFDKKHHFTLYYYDQAGNLIKTVPPAGVQLLNIDPGDNTGVGQANQAAIIADRSHKPDQTNSFFTDHKLATRYEYNSLNQLVKQSNPDNENMKSWSMDNAGDISSDVNLKGIQFSGGIGYAIGNNVNNQGVIYISTNNGSTWTPVTTIGLNNLKDIAFVDASTGYAISDNGYLLKTIDGGTNWSPVNLPVHESFKDIYFLNSSLGFIVGDNGTILQTNSSGSTWTSINGITTANLNDIQFAKDNSTGTIVGSGGTVLYTIDAGATWASPLTPLATNIVLNDAFVYQPDNTGAINVLFAGYTANAGSNDGCIINGINLNSININNSWLNRYNTAGKELNTISVSEGLLANDVSDDIGYAAGNNGTFIKTADGGLSWNAESVNWITTVPADRDVTELSIPDEANFANSSTPTAPYAYATLKNGKILRYNYASTPHWSEIANPVSAAQLNGIWVDKASPTVAYLAGNGGVVSKYLNDGSNSGAGTFLDLTNRIFSNLNGVTASQDNSGFIYAVGNNGSIIQSIDNGSSWNYMSSGTSINLNAAWFPSSTNGVVVGDQGYIATVSGSIVAQQSAGVFSSINIYDVTKKPVSTGSYYAVGSNGKVLSATATGTNWTAATVGSTSWFDIYFKNTSHVYIVGANGTFAKSTDGGTSWVSHTTPVNVDLHEVYFADDFIGYAFGDNSTIIKTIDGGLNWIQENTSNFAGSNYNGVAFTANGQALISSSTAPNLVSINDQSDDHSAHFLYDRLGRLIISQNTKQFNKTPKAYSYTVYDNLGRISEVGEIAIGVDPELSTNYNGVINESVYDNWLNNSGGVKSQVTITIYDHVASTCPGNFVQTNLRKRVSASYITEDGNLANYLHATYYSYDVHGNVKKVMQDNPSMTSISKQYQTIDYDYDLVSGKVNEVIYQKDQPDVFYHKYEYDSDDRITNVYTSKDDIIWEQDAEYFYYKHGPLARTEIGDLKVQATDYAYTLQGWIKGVNSTSLNALNDIGKDGLAGSMYTQVQNDVHKYIGEDAYGYSLNYYSSVDNTVPGTPVATLDYQAIDQQKYDYKTANASLAPTSFDANPLKNDFFDKNNKNSLYNGNISSMQTSIYDLTTSIAKPQLTTYKYDQLNRISLMKSYSNISDNRWDITPAGTITPYQNEFTYDANGNILTQKKYDQIGALEDDLSYKYDIDGNSGVKRSNKLYHVQEAAPVSTTLVDIEDQGVFTPAAPNQLGLINTENNYRFDEIGNLVGDVKEQISNIDWNVYGKIKSITRTTGSTKPDLEFVYDSQGNRIAKIVKLRPTGVLDPANKWEVTYYVRDAQGNVMATYLDDRINNAPTLKELDIFGNARLGVVNLDVKLSDLQTIPSQVGTTYSVSHTREKTNYELANHLGNVLTVVADRRVAVDNATYDNAGLFVNSTPDGKIDHYKPKIISANDYYPFGSVISGRSFHPNAYKYGSNAGSEKDDEITGIPGAHTTAENWEYDTRLGKRWNVDPIIKPWESPYTTFGDNPIYYNDPSGLDKGDKDKDKAKKPKKDSGGLPNGNGMRSPKSKPKTPKDTPKDTPKEGPSAPAPADPQPPLGPSNEELKEATRSGFWNAFHTDMFFGIGRGNPLEEYTDPILQKAYAKAQMIGDAFAMADAAVQIGGGNTMTAGGLSEAAATGGTIILAEAAIPGLAVAGVGALISAHGSSVIAVATAESVKTAVIINAINAHDGNKEASSGDSDTFKDSPPTDPGFKPAKNWNGKKVRNPNGKGAGYPDKNGDVWIPENHKGTHGNHWDVQSPGGKYRTVYPAK